MLLFAISNCVVYNEHTKAHLFKRSKIYTIFGRSSEECIFVILLELQLLNKYIDAISQIKEYVSP